MSSDERADQGVGPATEMTSSTAVVRGVERAVTELQTARAYIERDLKEGRDDIKQVLITLGKLETKVGELPSKTWIFSVAGGLIATFGVIVAVIYRLATGH